MTYDVVIVGGGIAGLTAAAYSTKQGYKTLLIEKEDKVGGLVSSFKVNDYMFDGGIRSIENSGIVQPMLNELEIDIEWLPSTVSLGIEDDVLKITGKESIESYQELLISKFPDNKQDVINIVKEVRKVMKYLDVLYGIDNPLFLDVKKHRKYYMTTILPWVFKFMFTFRKIEKLSTPIDEYLQKFTDNQSLIDVIGQHFFYKTPAFFALSYFSLYLDYRYPKGGTGTLIKKMKEYILKNDGEIQTNTLINKVQPDSRIVTDSKSNEYHYKELIWASDNRSLYKMLDTDEIKNHKIKEKVIKQQNKVKDLKGGDSIQTVFIGTTLKSDYFSSKNTGHFFYTPNKRGLNKLLYERHKIDLTSKEEVLKWLKDYYKYNTYEIAIPGLRDESVTNNGYISLVISTLMDFDIVKGIQEQGWYDEFKKVSEEWIIDVINDSIYPELKENIKLKFSSTPLTIEHRTNNTGGAITGWAFDNKVMPAVTSLPGVSKSPNTPIPHVSQAGAWSYSPAGLPISILTGKMAFNRVHKSLKKQK